MGDDVPWGRGWWGQIKIPFCLVALEARKAKFYCFEALLIKINGNERKVAQKVF